MRNVAIIDYGYGNIHSIAKALEKVKHTHRANVKLSHQVDDIKTATHIVLPGVGAFADCMKGLEHLPEVKEALIQAVEVEKKPFLGICVGMQLMAKKGFEHGEKAGLGWIDASVVAIPKEDRLKIPHMGWNNLKIKQPHPIFAGIKDGSDVYFVHSYFMQTKTPEVVYAEVDYGIPVPAVVVKDNKIGMQFHPEKSQQVGLQLLENFLAL
jgi:imidazole glycerol-phosphate synthase subunit HisH